MTAPNSGRPLCVLTGATSGIGRASAGELAAKGFDLVLMGRNRDRAESVRRQLSRNHPAGMFQVVICDLASFASVRLAAAEIRQEHSRIDVLINNAGQRIDTYQESPDGYELTFATNYLGHFLFTGLILDLVLASASGRVVTVSSRRHRCVNEIRNWIVKAGDFDRWGAYDMSKLANTVFGIEMARRLSPFNVSSNLVDPGIVASGFARNNGLIPWAKHLVSSLVHRQLVTPAHAAETVVHLAADPAFASGRTGEYHYEKSKDQPSPLSLDPAVAGELWRMSLDWVGLTASNCPAWRVYGKDSPVLAKRGVAQA